MTSSQVLAALRRGTVRRCRWGHLIAGPNRRMTSGGRERCVSCWRASSYRSNRRRRQGLDVDEDEVRAYAATTYGLLIAAVRYGVELPRQQGARYFALVLAPPVDDEALLLTRVPPLYHPTGCDPWVWLLGRLAHARARAREPVCRP